MSLTKNIHWDDYTSPSQARQLREYVFKEVSNKNPYGLEQTAVVMSPPQPASTRELAGLTPLSDESVDIKNNSARVFRVKYVQQANKRRPAGEALPDFESLATTSDVFATRNKTVNLPICVATSEVISRTGIPKVGDLIKIRTVASELDPDIPSLQMCEMYDVEEISLLSANENPASDTRRNYEFLFEGTDTTLADQNFSSSERSRARPVRTSLSITWQQALEISQGRTYKKLGKWIKSAEGVYESVIGQLTGWTDPITGKRVDQMTLAEVQAAQRGSIKNLGRTSTAVGAYQWIRDTMTETIDYFKKTSPNIDMDSLIFNGRTQEAMSVYLLFAKRPTIGNYLLGVHENHSEAGQQMAYEWASIPIQYAVTSPLKGCNKTVYPGQSAYEGCAGNRVSSLSGHRPEDLVALLKEAQTKFASLGVCDNIRANNNLSVVASLASTGAAEGGGGVSEVTEEEELAMLESMG
jgi:hypothetical protein